MKRLILFASILIGFISLSKSQTGGEIQGRIIDQTNAGIPFANVVVYLNDVQVNGAATDFDGYFNIKPLNPGKYKVVASYLDKKVTVNEVVVSNGQTTFLDKMVINTTQELEAVEYVYKKPPVDVGKPEAGNTVSREEIAKMPKNNLIGIITNTGGTYSADDNSTNISIGGSRFNANKYVIDGVDMTGSVYIPTEALDEVQIITSGFDASIGDMTGGVINMSTRGPSKETHGSIELLTSQFLDAFGYNEAKFSLLGPIYTKDKGTETARTVIGYLLTGSILYEKDKDPPAIPLFVVKDDVLEGLKETPLVPSPQGEGLVKSTEFLTMDDLEEIPYKPNNSNRAINLFGKLDWKPSLTTNLTLGSSIYYNEADGYVRVYSLMNNENNPFTSFNTNRFYGKFYQRFPDRKQEEGETRKTGFTLGNAYYTILADFQISHSKVMDKNHEDNFFDYGYIGNFNTYRTAVYGQSEDSLTGLTSNNVLLGYGDTAVVFQPGDANPVLTKYTEIYYQNNDPFTLSQVLLGGGLRNGDFSQNLFTYSLWYNPGVPYTQYALSDDQQYGLRFDASFDLKKSTEEQVQRHAIQFGFEFQQRVETNYSINPYSLWSLMRQSANRHIRELNYSQPYIITGGDTIPYQDYKGDVSQLVDTIWYERRYIESDQSYFDRSLRQKLGYQVNSQNFINVDALDPDFFSLDMFSPDELLASGNRYVNAVGYDYYGNKLDYQPSFNDFWQRYNDENGNGVKDPGEYYERPVDAYRPIYTAGYVQDRFNIGQVQFRVGVRVDRFDGNQKVLRDPYSLYPIKTVAEVDDFEHPATVGEGYKVYVNDLTNPTTIVGYRDGNTWYNADGNEIFDASAIANQATTGTITPYLVNPSADIKSASFDPDQSFEDYNPQITVMPRIAFSFPITETAMFTAHYDVLTQRPLSGVQANPYYYYYMQELAVSAIIPNANLKPEKTINYQLGFQQALNDASRIALSAFYKELRDMTQIIKYNFAYPIDYRTYGNIDFGTVKGLTASYDMVSRIKNVMLTASYTLQFADGTGSNATSQLSLIGAGQPNLRTIIPLNYDVRHTFNVNVDYRFSSGKDYNGPVWFNKDVLANAGIFISFRGRSGEPYTRQGNATPEGQFGVAGRSTLEGQINGSRLPWNFKIDTRIDKDFAISRTDKAPLLLNVYLMVQNVLDTRNIISVYNFTGSPIDDGYIDAPATAQVIDAQLNEQSFIDLYRIKVMNPDNYSLPRRIQLGAQFKF